jgi:hypothetical protein
MPGQGFDINVTSSEVLVKQDGSLQSGGSRVAAGVISILAAAYLFAFTVIIDKHGRPGLWYDLKSAPRDSFGFYFLLLCLVGILVFCGYLLLIGLRLFFPAGEQLQCDRTAFTYSNIPWISLRGRWKRRSFPVSTVTELIYGVIREGNPEKNIQDTYGLSFYVADKEYKIFGGLEAPDADDILKTLRAFGVDDRQSGHGGNDRQDPSKTRFHLRKLVKRSLIPPTLYLTF